MVPTPGGDYSGFDRVFVQTMISVYDIPYFLRLFLGTVFKYGLTNSISHKSKSKPYAVRQWSHIWSQHAGKGNVIHVFYVLSSWSAACETVSSRPIESQGSPRRKIWSTSPGSCCLHASLQHILTTTHPLADLQQLGTTGGLPTGYSNFHQSEWLEIHVLHGSLGKIFSSPALLSSLSEFGRCAWLG